MNKQQPQEQPQTTPIPSQPPREADVLLHAAREQKDAQQNYLDLIKEIVQEHEKERQREQDRRDQELINGLVSQIQEVRTQYQYPCVQIFSRNQALRAKIQELQQQRRLFAQRRDQLLSEIAGIERSAEASQTRRSQAAAREERLSQIWRESVADVAALAKPGLFDFLKGFLNE